MKIFKLSNTFCLLSCSPYFVMILLYNAGAGAKPGQARRAIAVELPCARDLECSRHSTTYDVSRIYKLLVIKLSILSIVPYPNLEYMNFKISSCITK